MIGRSGRIQFEDAVEAPKLHLPATQEAQGAELPNDASEAMTVDDVVEAGDDPLALSLRTFTAEAQATAAAVEEKRVFKQEQARKLSRWEELAMAQRLTVNANRSRPATARATTADPRARDAAANILRNANRSRPASGRTSMDRMFAEQQHVANSSCALPIWDSHPSSSLLPSALGPREFLGAAPSSWDTSCPRQWASIAPDGGSSSEGQPPTPVWQNANILAAQERAHAHMVARARSGQVQHEIQQEWLDDSSD